MVDTTGFVTALVINAIIAVIATLVFVWLRPKYPWCYDTRRNPKRRIIGAEPPTHPPGAFGWISRTFSMTDGEVLETSGLDALMLIKFFEMAATLFVALTVLGLGILLPVNFTSHGDVSDSFDQLSMANIPQGSRRFWAHLLIGYVFSFTFYYLAWHTWRSYLNLRHQFLARWTLLGGNHTIMIHNLPTELHSDKALLAHFSRLFPGQIRSARMAKDLSMPKQGANKHDCLEDNVSERDEVVAALEHDVVAWEKQQADPKLKPEKKSQRPMKALKCFCCSKVDAIDHNYEELQRLNSVISTKQSEFNGRDGLGDAGDRVPVMRSAFVTFHSARAAVAAHSAYIYDATPFSFLVKPAPELRDVYWPSLKMSFTERSVRTLVFNVVTGLLILFWMVPMGALMALSNLQGLAEKWPSALSGINSIPSVILGFIQAYLPALLLVVFFAVLPLILLAFSKAQGIEAHSWLQKSVIHKYYLFMVINFFFGAIVGGSIFSNLEGLLSDVNGIPTVLGEQIPTVSNYFVNYVALAAFAGFPLQMAQLGRVIVGSLKKKYMCLTAREFETAEAAPELDYGVTYCPHLFIFLIAMTYSFISPIIIPFAACYFILGWLVFKYQLVHVFVQRFESGGTFWPVVYSKMSTSLLIAQLCLVGIFGLKEVPAQAVLVIPMPILTLLFDRYIHHAIKEKVVSLPLPQLVDIDAQRKAERVEREALVAKGKSLGFSNGSGSSTSAAPSTAAPSNADEAQQQRLPQGDSQLVSKDRTGSLEMDAQKLQQLDQTAAVSTDLPKSEMQYSDRAEAPAGLVRTHPHLVEQKDSNDQTWRTASYQADEERNEANLAAHKPAVATQALGFPYRDDEQHRAFVEGDVEAYVQPEITDAVPGEVEVARAAQYVTGGAAPAGAGAHHVSVRRNQAEQMA